MIELKNISLETYGDVLNLLRENIEDKDKTESILRELLNSDTNEVSVLTSVYMIITSINGFDREILGKDGFIMHDLRPDDIIIDALIKYNFDGLIHPAYEAIKQYEAKTYESKWLISKEVLQVIDIALYLLESQQDEEKEELTFICINKIKGDKNRIVSYELQHLDGTVREVSTEALKMLLKEHTIKVTNLQLKSGKIVNK